MAKKPAASSSKPAASEKKTILIVMVILLILANIVQAVVLYTSMSETTLANEKVKAAAKTEADAKNARDEMRSRLLALRSRVGVATAEDQQQLEDLKAARAANKEEVAKEMGTWDSLNNSLGRLYRDDPEGAQKAKDAVVTDAVALAIKQAEDAKATAASKTEALEKAEANYLAKLDEQKALVKKYDEAAKKAEKEKKDVEDKKNAALEAALADRDAKSKEIEDLKRQASEAEDKSKKDYAVLAQRVKDLELAKQKLEAKLPPVNVLDYENPKGTIVSVDAKTGKVFIDKGSADGIRAGLTFSILPPDAKGKGAINRERKGAIEIEKVEGPHLSMAKLTDVSDPTRDPVLARDLIFNPAFRPDLKEHVALAGIIDLNGDGLDDNMEFIRLLERQGVMVDGYMDLRELTMKGRGITDQTSYLIVGEMPVIGEGKVNERDQKVIEAISKVRLQAKELGVESISARKFMAKMGLQVPAKPQAGDYNSGVYTRPTKRPGEGTEK